MSVTSRSAERAPEGRGKIRQQIPYIAALLVPALYVAVFGNPFLRWIEAGPTAYYQGRVAYERSDYQGKETLARAFEDGTLSVKEYSDLVFPAYLNVSENGEDLFPPAEREKSLAQLKSELSRTIGVR